MPTTGVCVCVCVCDEIRFHNHDAYAGAKDSAYAFSAAFDSGKNSLCETISNTMRPMVLMVVLRSGAKNS